MLLKKRLISLALAATLAFSLTACGDSDDIVGLPEGIEDMSEEELQELVDAYENGDTDGAATEGKKEAGNSGGLLGSLPKADTGKQESYTVPKLGLRITTDYNYSEDREKLIFKGGVQAPLVTSDCEEDFPALAKVLKENADAAFAAYKTDAAEYTKEAQEHYHDSPEFFNYGGYESATSILLRRLDDTILSYAKGWNAYLGGAHGSYSEEGHTYDVKTGKELSLTDILPDVSGLNAVLTEKLLEKYDPEEFFNLEDSLSHYDPELTEYQEGTDSSEYAMPYTWWLSPLGIEFYFGEYALTSYASGSQTVVIGYDEYPRAFAAEYVPKETGSFIYDFNMSTDVFDVTGDGKPDDLFVDYDYDGENYDYYSGVSLYLNGQKDSFNKDLWIDRASYKSHYIRLQDGSQYVYAEGYVFDDHKEFFVFDLNSGSAKAVDRSYLDYASYVLKGETDYNQNMITDPDNMEMEELFYILSTFYGRRTYHVGADGMPESDERYTVENLDIRNTLTSKRELTCDIVDEDGNVISSGETIASGETFFLLFTDGETYVDARLSDGRIARLHITDTQYPAYVDGVAADECFEELFYVG